MHTRIPFELRTDQGIASYRSASRCVGIGKCRGDEGGVMCPSYRVTREEEHSTRGRARLLMEMVRGEVITAGWHSAEVRDALDLCLACKGCRKAMITGRRPGYRLCLRLKVRTAGSG